MSKKLRNLGKIKLPTQRDDVPEFRLARAGMVRCPRCFCFFYKKSWHHALPQKLSPLERRRLRFQSRRCPACIMIMHKQYEGKVEIRNIPAAQRPAIIRLVRSFCETAFRDDCQHRLISINMVNGDLDILTTENQLALRLAKKIRDVFKKAMVSFHHAGPPSDVLTTQVIF